MNRSEKLTVILDSLEPGHQYDVKISPAPEVTKLQLSDVEFRLIDDSDMIIGSQRRWRHER